MKKKINKETIEVALLNLVENTDWKEDQIIKRVAEMFRMSTKKVAEILNNMDF